MSSFDTSPLHTSSDVLVDGPLLITPSVFSDTRGFFFESWNINSFRESLLASGLASNDVYDIKFCQDNHSSSVCGVLRGLHYQIQPQPQGKLVRCSLGEIFDVAVDLRRDSPTFGSWVSAILSSSNFQQMWIPAGFAHGFLTLSQIAEVQYKATGFWNKNCERSLYWNDPSLAIAWPLKDLGLSEPLLSNKDKCAFFLKSYLDSDEVII